MPKETMTERVVKKACSCSSDRVGGDALDGGVDGGVEGGEREYRRTGALGRGGSDPAGRTGEADGTTTKHGGKSASGFGAVYRQ